MAQLQQDMLDYRFRPSPRFGQNFIVDENLLARMVDAAGLKKTDVVLEIGCGTGFLTEMLLRHCKVVGVENDESLVELLREKFGGGKGFTLVGESFLAAELPKFTKVVALPPYNISSEIMLRLFECRFEKAVLVFQREFVEKMTALPGFKEHGHLSVLTDLLFKPMVLIQNISPKAFYPKPSTYSSLVVLEPKKTLVPAKDIPLFISFTKNVFRYKNKNLSNSLKNCFREMNGKARTTRELEAFIEKKGLADLKTNLLSTEELVGVFTRISRV